jgi:hypothetical protein
MIATTHLWEPSMTYQSSVSLSALTAYLAIAFVGAIILGLI